MKLTKLILLLLVLFFSVFWNCSNHSNPFTLDPSPLKLTVLSTNIITDPLNSDSIYIECQSNRDSTLFFFKLDSGEWISRPNGIYTESNLLIGSHTLFIKGVLENNVETVLDSLPFQIFTKAPYIKLPTGGYNISQMYYLNGYIYALVNTEPLKFYKISASDINKVTSVNLPFRQDAKSQFCYSKATNKFYMFYGSLFETYICEIDPETLVYNSEFVNDRTEGLLIGAISADDSSLYLVTCRYINRGWTGALVRKYPINEPSDSSIFSVRLDSLYSKVRSSQYLNDYLYISGSYDSVSSFVARISSDFKKIDFLTLENKSVSDNSTIFEGKIYFGFSTTFDNKGTIVQLNPNTFSINYFPSLTYPCTGINSDSKNVYAIFNSNEGILVKVDSANVFNKYILEFAQPSVSCSNGQNVFITFKGDSTIVQSLDQRYLTSRLSENQIKF